MQEIIEPVNAITRTRSKTRHTCKVLKQTQEILTKPIGLNDFFDDESDLSLDLKNNSEVIKRIRKKKRTRESKAHNLWINYGRKLIDYCLSQTIDAEQQRCRKLIGRLRTKRDYELVYQNDKRDSYEDRQFKHKIRKLSLEFIETKAKSAFKQSRYSKELVQQKHIVKHFLQSMDMENEHIEEEADGNKINQDPLFIDWNEYYWRIYGKLILGYCLLHLNREEIQNVIGLTNLNMNEHMFFINFHECKTDTIVEKMFKAKLRKLGRHFMQNEAVKVLNDYYEGPKLWETREAILKALQEPEFGNEKSLLSPGRFLENVTEISTENSSLDEVFLPNFQE